MGGISPLEVELQDVVSSPCPAPERCVSTNLKGTSDTKGHDAQQEEQHRALCGITPQSNIQYRAATLGSSKGQEWGL